MKYQYNDNELLYLMDENEDALGILFEKYFILIHKRIRGFKIKSKSYEDYFQEGLMALNDAINTYNPIFNKSFNKYFDLILQRRIIRLLKKERHYFYGVTLVGDINSVIKEDMFVYQGYDFGDILNEFEKMIYELRFKKYLKPTAIAKEMNCNIKKVYNTLYILKQKIKQQLEE